MEYFYIKHEGKIIFHTENKETDYAGNSLASSDRLLNYLKMNKILKNYQIPGKKRYLTFCLYFR
jgi:hypothetical protein